MVTDCKYFNLGVCQSCQWLPIDYSQQLLDKQHWCAQQLPNIPEALWQPIFASKPQAFRNKAKMVVTGTWQTPVLGIVDRDFKGTDLTECLLYPPEILQTFALIKDWIRQCRLQPYDIAKRKGELKYVLLTLSQSTGELMLRLVLRSKSELPSIQSTLSSLQQLCPKLSVISVNIQPQPAAIVEGAEEILLTENASLTMWLNGLPMHLKPQSFFQTNDEVAAGLYRQAQGWLEHIQPKALWDLFCGVGGFALHAAKVVEGQIVGIEVSKQAIDSASLSAKELGFANCQFRALKADEFALHKNRKDNQNNHDTDLFDLPDAVIVNPPRRGIGEPLCEFLNQAKSVQWLIYSSCNPTSLDKDLALMPEFEVQQARVFDMFAHSAHAEVIVLLKRLSS